MPASSFLGTGIATREDAGAGNHVISCHTGAQVKVRDVAGAAGSGCDGRSLPGSRRAYGISSTEDEDPVVCLTSLPAANVATVRVCSESGGDVRIAALMRK